MTIHELLNELKKLKQDVDDRKPMMAEVATRLEFIINELERLTRVK